MNYEEMFSKLAERGYIVDDPSAFLDNIGNVSFDELLEKIDMYENENNITNNFSELESNVMNSFYTITNTLVNDELFLSNSEDNRLELKNIINKLNDNYFLAARVTEAKEELKRVIEEKDAVKKEIDTISNSDMSKAEKSAKYPALFTRLTELGNIQKEKEAIIKSAVVKYNDKEDEFGNRFTPGLDRHEYRANLMGDFRRFYDILNKLELTDDTKRIVNENWDTMYNSYIKMSRIDAQVNENINSDDSLLNELRIYGITKNDEKVEVKESEETDINESVEVKEEYAEELKTHDNVEEGDMVKLQNHDLTADLEENIIEESVIPEATVENTVNNSEPSIVENVTENKEVTTEEKGKVTKVREPKYNKKWGKVLFNAAAIVGLVSATPLLVPWAAISLAGIVAVKTSMDILKTPKDSYYQSIITKINNLWDNTVGKWQNKITEKGGPENESEQLISEINAEEENLNKTL